ncbi:MAG: histidine kinase [Epsilonproteobacteria bacterium]|nr:MAG: histidine kinase [Campylobacterota bacterium]
MVKLVRMKILRVLLLIISIIFTLNAKELEKVSLQLQWLDQFQFAGYYMAKEKGYYNDVGIDLEIRKFKYTINPISEVTSNRANYGIGRSSLIIDKSNGKNIKLLHAAFQSSALILLSTKKSNINSVKDFVGKRVMTTSDAYLSASLHAMANHEHIDSSDMIEQEHSFNIDDLINGNTDLMASYISNEPFLLEERGIEYSIFNPKDYGFDFYGDILFTSDQEVQNHPLRAKNFRDASIKGWEYAFSHINESVDFIFKNHNPQNKSKAALKFEAKELKKLAYYKTDELGHLDASKIQRIYDVYNVMGFVKKSIDIDAFLFHDDLHRLATLSKEEVTYLKNKKEITMCVIPNMLPLSKIDKNQHIGISADYMDIVSDKLNIKIKLIPTSTIKETMQNLKLKKCELSPLLLLSNDRKKYLNFSTSYLSTSWVVVTKFDKPFVSDLDSIKEKKFAAIRDTTHIEILKNKYKYTNIVEVDNYKEGLNLVLEGKVYGVVGNLITLGYQIGKDYSNLLKVSATLSDKEAGKMAIIKDDIILLSILNKTINNISQKEIQEIYNRWINIKYEKEADYTLVINIIIIFSLILFVIILFLLKQNSLKKEIEVLNENLNKRVKEEIQKNKEKEIIFLEQSRLAQMGEMISMIAHQWRQPLGAISASVVNLRLKLELDNLDTKDDKEECSAYFLTRLSKIENYIQNLSTTVDDFRNFYKPNKVSVNTSLESILKKSLNIIGSSLDDKGIEIQELYDSNERFKIYDSEMMQVILNIFKNAEDNFRDKKITDAKITIRTFKNSLFICDNGGGIPKDIMPNIFDPYFSTKDEKNGTGLGLYMSKTIVEEHHNGTLHVENTDKGVCFI